MLNVFQSGNAGAVEIRSLAPTRFGHVKVWGAMWNGSSQEPAFLPDGLTNITAIAAGNSHCVALRTDGTVTTWDRKSGAGMATIQLPPEITNVVALAAGYYFNLLLKSDGVGYRMGGGPNDAPSNFRDLVAIGAGVSLYLGIKADGSVMAFGPENRFGELNVPSGLRSVVSASGGSSHVLALKADGTLAAWGDNSNGKASIPAGLNGVVKIAVGYNHNLALKSDGTVFAWGANDSGQTSVPAKLSNIVDIAGGEFHSLALRTDGTVVAWGSNSHGQTTIPVGLTNVMAVDAGGLHSLALIADGILAIPPKDGSPVISVQPKSTEAALGGFADFIVAVTNVNGARYQWRFNGARIIGATNNLLSLRDITELDFGEYLVEISNQFGTIKSQIAKLTRFIDSDHDGLSDNYEKGSTRYQIIQGNYTWSSAKAQKLTRKHGVAISRRSPAKPNGT